MASMELNDAARSPLEEFLREYVTTVGGVWDEVEPQVYDLMLPGSSVESGSAEPLLTRITFDPEALPDHPRAQLASLGTPLVDQLLTAAVGRARFLELYLTGLNLQSRAWLTSLQRAFSLRTPSAKLQAVSARALDFPQMVFWFEVTFASDQREQEILPLAVDLHYGRQTRHLDKMLNTDRLETMPDVVFPTATLVPRDSAYRLAREQVTRTVGALANGRNRELQERLDKQVRRMTQYYDDLRKELDEQARRAAARTDADDAKIRARRTALDRERELRVAEMRKKNHLTVQLKLLNTLVIHQPKLAVELTAVDARDDDLPELTAPLSVVWDPLAEAWEAAVCPHCQRPTFELGLLQRTLVCPQCQTAGPTDWKRRPR